jgi:hypothetical protein
MQEQKKFDLSINVISRKSISLQRLKELKKLGTTKQSLFD